MIWYILTKIAELVGLDLVKDAVKPYVIKGGKFVLKLLATFIFMLDYRHKKFFKREYKRLRPTYLTAAKLMEYFGVAVITFFLMGAYLRCFNTLDVVQAVTGGGFIIFFGYDFRKWVYSLKIA